MGNYLGVNAVKTIGKKVLAVPIEDKPTIPTGCFLVAIMCDGVWAIAPEVTDYRDYIGFVEEYKKGNYLNMTSYLVNEDQRDNCPDEGRVDCLSDRM